MKRFFITITFMLSLLMAYGQTKTSGVIVRDTVHVFKLYPTKNMWTFIKLNTTNGQMWQVHFTVNEDGRRVEHILSLTRQAEGKDAVCGRFELYPTDNMYNFILLDQIDGRTWQVQWSFNYHNRGLIPINEELE